MRNRPGPRRKIDHQAVINFATANPTALQSEIAKHFGTTQSRVSAILRSNGIKGIARGHAPKPKPNLTDEQNQWERILHDAGLGMERGMRLNRKRILYGFDVRKEGLDDGSATSNGTSEPLNEAA